MRRYNDNNINVREKEEEECFTSCCIHSCVEREEKKQNLSQILPNMKNKTRRHHE